MISFQLLSSTTLHLTLTLAPVICLIHPVLSISYDDKIFYYPINSENQFIQKKKIDAPPSSMTASAEVRDVIWALRPWDAKSIPATAA